ncbi:Gfo/Idh/MocA family protein [Amycolatopsis sp. 195334CR]|uniref:Gfo/Idh/MocA family protein n=1 Tax=Amycolatopsis sp. 195334CR TaxID=2814588 RepID=UPI001A8E4A27|nr:Gfo/Idh/MocA family oxidoreductase [Amycolatopsis sp. 195334CR]MBN6033967.1 Gfo/Idh/MocA family oxidoreductase [Amycolatopsis sp. 195334CR]
MPAVRFLLVGLSRFARRRVLPAASALDGIEVVDVASAHGGEVPGPGRRHTDWHAALDSTEPALVYVSTVNSTHAEVVRHALRRGHHVVVDKPAFLTLDTAEELVELARSRSLVLAEATNYSFHPMFSPDLTKDITKAVAVFTPPVPPEDFRHKRSSGGGAFLDTGPYFASLGRVLWGVEPDDVHVIVGDRTADGLELAYSVLAGYPGGRTVVGQFGFTTHYRNNLQLLGPGVAVDVPRPFSAPPDLTADLHFEIGGVHETRSVPPADSMELFLGAVLSAVRSGSREFDAALLSDARTRDRVVRAAR